MRSPTPWHSPSFRGVFLTARPFTFSLQPQLIPRRSSQLRELVNCNAGNNSLGDLAQVLVMRQINHLASACHLTKQPEKPPRTGNGRRSPRCRRQ